MRASRVLAVLRRDLAIEFAGRRGLVLPLVASFVMFPMAVAPNPIANRAAQAWKITGDIPPELAARDDVEVVGPEVPGATRIVGPSEANGHTWMVASAAVPPPVRETLDRLDPHVRTDYIEAPPTPLPKRSMLLALVAASMLTGPLAQSLPGERSQRTLETLLTASITRGELVLGKWLAWGGFGAMLAVLSTLGVLLRGIQAPGLWVLAVPWVSLGTVALGFYLVRRARDVVGGATMAIRMLPAALTFLGLLAWLLGLQDPYLGALVPIGGALLAAGDAWGGAAAPTLIAVTVTAAMCATFLAATARDLDPELAQAGDHGLVPAVVQAGAAAVVWWTALLGSQIWTYGGAPERTAVIPTSDTVTAGGLGLLAIATVRLARTPYPLQTLGPVAAPARAWGLALALGVVIRLATQHPLAPMMHGPPFAASLARLHAGLDPGWAGPVALVVVLVAQEVLFRGWMRRRAGDLATAVLFALVVSPGDPLAGLVLGVGLAVLARVSLGSLFPGLLARALAAALPLADLPTGWDAPIAVGAFVTVALGIGLIWPRADELVEAPAGS